MKSSQLVGILPETPILTYSGSLGTWYMLDEMLELFQEFRRKRPGAKFLILTKDLQVLNKAIEENKCYSCFCMVIVDI